MNHEREIGIRAAVKYLKEKNRQKENKRYVLTVVFFWVSLTLLVISLFY